jgi:hypothetical protein
MLITTLSSGTLQLLAVYQMCYTILLAVTYQLRPSFIVMARIKTANYNHKGISKITCVVINASEGSLFPNFLPQQKS